jgi:transcriptional regulator with XRE-family HTH domain
LSEQPKKGNFADMSEITPEQARAARALLDWSQEDAADRAKITPKTLRDFETGQRDPRVDTLSRLRAAFERAGVDFIPENGGGPGVRLRKPAAKRKR